MNAIYIYRIANFLYLNKIPLIPKLLYWFNFLVFNSVVPSSAKIGANTKFAYGGIGVVLHSESIIGCNVIIGQGVTIGRKLDPVGVPVIGNDVYIAAGSRILGAVRVGNNVIIGANAVVIHDIPDNSIVAGAPAKVIKTIDANIYSLLKNIY
jgi:serine O-acetyltransferase